MLESFSIRSAVETDSDLLLQFIRELAEYEKLPHEVRATSEQVRNSFFGESPIAHALIASIANQPAGFAVYFFTYSTFEGAPVLYLEDVFVRPEFRRRGIGQELFRELARKALNRDCTRFEFVVLDWNEQAHRFYKSIGAQPRSEWVRFRMDRTAMEKAAAEPPPLFPG